MDELVAEFLTETNESIEELDADLVNLEQNPNDKDLLSKIFRLVHTVKGTCGFLGLTRLEKVAHSGENVLGLFRDGTLEVTPEYVTLIFESIDRIKEILAGLEETGAEPEGDDSALIAKLDAVYEGKGLEGAEAAQQENQEESNEAGAPDNSGEAEPDEHGFVPVPAPSKVKQDAEKAAAPEPQATEPAPATEDSQEAAPAGGAKTPVSAQTLRVNVDVLENLMTMVSELVLTRNQLLQISRSMKDTDQSESDLTTPLQRLNHVVSDLQEGVMQTRMQPIGNAWAKLPRIVRDITIELGKKIDLEMRGKETELDRQVLELIKDPLTHMVRNSADHGIESPADRVAAGKPETGKIILNAYHEGGHINIKISDDGKGLSSEKIKAKVIANGLATPEELEEMSPQQIQQFIFKAGFSTAEKVTSVSGRGVGMDVVRTNIEKIGGSIDLKSEEGKGSTFTIKIPLTLAIVSALIVEAGGEKFAIPQLSVQELVMTNEGGDNRIERINDAPVLRLRDHLLPLVTLADLLSLKSPVQDLPAPDLPSEDTELEGSLDEEDTEKTGIENVSRNSYIVVLEVGAYNFGIIVDKVFDTEEIVVKPVARILRNNEMFSGNTILGDGSVIMILDPNGIAKVTGEVEAVDQGESTQQKEREEERHAQSKTSLLLFAAGDEAPKAVPLSLVARLEQIDLSTIERSGGQMMVQYRDELMPLLPFSEGMDVGSQGTKPVLVFTDQTRSLGLIVDDIIDIKEEHVKVQIEGRQNGLIGSAIINEKATDVIDVGHYLGSINKDWFKDHGDEPYKKNGKGPDHAQKRILLIDDSPFFRNMLTPLLSVAGYDVTTLESPVDALDLCEQGEAFDLIVSDIEMPDMDGFEFAEKIREDSTWQNTPMVALSSHATPQDIERGLEVGFTKYIAKFDRETLLNTLSQTLAERDQQVGEAA